MSAFEDRVGLPAGSCHDVEADLRSGNRRWIVMSGKMCSGKDTIAERLRDDNTVIASYGDLIRGDFAKGLGIAHAYAFGEVDYDSALNRVIETTSLSPSHASEYLSLLKEDILRLGEVTSTSRTDNIRYILQNFGDTWRTANDPDYWARPGSVRSVEMIREGRDVINAGSRFAPDVEIPRLAGAVIIRLDVTPETQLRRLYDRDGIEATDKTLAAMAHPGETALDDFAHDLRLSNDRDGDEFVDMLVSDIRHFLKERCL